MTIDDLAKQLCHDFVRRVGRWEQRAFIVTNFRYPDGDLVNVYIDPDGGSLFTPDASAVFISDMGTTLMKCRQNGVELSGQRTDFVNQVCERYGVQIKEGELLMQVDQSEPGRDCLAFCEAITRISAIEYDRDRRSTSPIPALVEELLTRRVLPPRELQRNWTDPVLDPHESHAVDYRVNGKGYPERHIFTATHADKCTHIAMVAHFFQSKQKSVPTLVVVDAKANISGVYLDRLQKATDQIIEGVDGAEERIVKFALAK